MDVPSKKAPRHRDDRVILHFDLDCFYAQCIENRQPSLRTLPLGIKQKGILATCNYVARRHGVKKLMPIAEARKICPDLVLADGEDLSPFRDVSKRLYALLRASSWNGKVERLGLDEFFLDVTDIVEYNVGLLNRNALPQSYFCLSLSDPEVGFSLDATSFAGCVIGVDNGPFDGNALRMRLLMASHLAQYLRLKIEDEGYTTACGIATNKLLAKLVGDKNKPRNQTTLFALNQEDVLSFMDQHSLRKVPGIGSKSVGALERVVIGKEPDPNVHTMECSTTAGQVRTHPGILPPTLERLLSGPGAERGLGTKVWSLLHGVDDTDVKPARDVPTQISIEDTYKGLNEPHEIHRALLAITTSLLRRMHIDLLEDDPNLTTTTPGTTTRKYLAYPKTIRLTTRPYHPPSDTKPYNFARASRSTPLPSFVFHNNPPHPNPTTTTNQVIAERLVVETLLPLFYKLNPAPPGHSLGQGKGKGEVEGEGKKRGGWDIGLLNVCVTNMTGAEGGGVAGSGGRDIGDMFRRQEGVLREFTVYDLDDGDGDGGADGGGGEGEGLQEGRRGCCEIGDAGGGEVVGGEEEGEDEDDDLDTWDHDDALEEDAVRCPLCGCLIPRFAVVAHERYHSAEDP